MLDLCIDGFKIMHGTGFATMDPNDAETPGGGGIYLHNCSGVAVVNNEITENTGANGGGLLSAGTCPGTFILADNKIWKNKTWSTNCDATEGYGGGGGVMTVDRRAMIRDNSVSDNATPSSHKECMGYRLATPSGGGIRLDGGICFVVGNDISGNPGELENPVTDPMSYGRATEGGAIFTQKDNPGLLFIYGNSMIDNHTRDHGSAIAIEFSPAIVINNLIWSNEIMGPIESNHCGGAISVFHGGSFVINNTFVENTSICGASVFNSTGDAGNPAGSATFSNNIVAWNSGLARPLYVPGGYEGQPQHCSNNVYWQNDPEEDLSHWPPHIPGMTETIEDPVVANRGEGDFHIVAYSPCIDMAADSVPTWFVPELLVPLIDLECVSRLTMPPQDIGCYEYRP